MVGTVSNLDLLSPFHPSYTHDETEAQVKAFFIDLFNELFLEKISDLHHYGMPMLGSPKVIERFTKQDGLAVLRRPDSSDLIMRVIYANWKSLASKRGLGFLEFVLQMIWTDRWAIQRMWHSYALRDQYPEHATITEESGSILTSRVMILIRGNIDVSELNELAPTIKRIVPANIVPIIAVDFDFSHLDYHAAILSVPFMIGSYQYHD